MIKPLLKPVILLLLALFSVAGYTQVNAQRKVFGTVSDPFGVLLPGVSVVIKGTTNGTATNSNGEFTIEIPSDKAVLEFSMLGYTKFETEAGSRNMISVIMAESAIQAEEVVVVGFGKQKKTDMVGAVSSVSMNTLKKVPSSNVTNMLAGNIAGIIAYQRSGEPGADNADFFIRGVTTFGYKKDPLILIDGIEVTSTDLARIQPDDIANFSIMKDATSTAVYGARGANGVIAITTKEGRPGKLSVTARFENAFTSPTMNVELADPITYMRLGNEAILTRDRLGMLPYSQSKIDNTIAGTNKYVYPATDWQKELFKDYSTVQRFNLNASGGGNVVRYYLAATFNQDNGILRVDKRNNFNNNIRLRTYSFRSNVNFDLTRTTEGVLRVSGTFDDYTGPIDGGTDIYNQVIHTNPVLFPAYYAPDEANMETDHILFGNYGTGNYLNPYANLVKGYKDYSRSKIDVQFELKQDFSFITNGLSAKAMFNTSRYSYFDVSRSYKPFLYRIGSYDRQTDTYMLSAINETSGTDYLGYNEGPKDVATVTYLEGMLNYDRLFKEKHSVSSMLVLQLRNELMGNAGDIQLSLPYRNMGLSGRATYNYDSRYFVEFNFGYNGSERFYKTHRWGFFPSVGVAWTISNEKFWKVPFIQNLKLRATYGLVGNDAIGSALDRFFYLSKVDMDNPHRASRFGEKGIYVLNGVTIGRYSNENITWEVARKLNLGFETKLWNSLTIEADYFREDRSRILMSRTSIPSTMGLQATEKANVGEAFSHGVDGSITFDKSFRNYFWIQGRANFTFATSAYTVYEESLYPANEWYRRHVGYPISQQWGYIAERLFVDDYEVASSPKQNFGEYAAGDIKYHDVNGDGRITDADKVPIGYPTDPEIMYGFGASFGWKGLDLSFFFQGSARSSLWIDYAATAPFNNQTQLLKAYADDYWSEDNRNNYALWPRLSSTINANNNQISTWFMRNGGFLRLKSVELGYTLPKSASGKIGLTNLRFYFTGTNLLCFSRFKLWDPEMGGKGFNYPIQKALTVGLTASF